MSNTTYPGERRPVVDPRPESRRDDQAERYRRAALAREIAREQAMAGSHSTVTTKHDLAALIRSRKPAGPIDWSNPVDLIE